MQIINPWTFLPLYSNITVNMLRLKMHYLLMNLGNSMSLPVDKAIRKAQSHIKAGELAEAEELYKQVLSKFPKNKKAIQGYQKLKAGSPLKACQLPSRRKNRFKN